eukprot:1185478-Prorocentrum_minimum.AAC.3
MARPRSNPPTQEGSCTCIQRRSVSLRLETEALITIILHSNNQSQANSWSHLCTNNADASQRTG